MIIWYLCRSQDTQGRALPSRQPALKFIPNSGVIDTSKHLGTGVGYQVK
jgi:hypothetical protein